MRDRIFAEMTAEWKDAYAAGIFTEFMEQRAPGHTVLGDVIYRKGLRELQAGDRRGAGARWTSSTTRRPGTGSRNCWPCASAAGAVIRFAERHAETWRESMARTRRPTPRAARNCEHIAEVCRRVPANAPRDFHEALQAYWFVHLGVITELNTWDSFCPGRLDQHLAPVLRSGTGATAR